MPLNNTIITNGAVTSIGSNQIGRYPIHFHHLMGPRNSSNTGYQFAFVGNAVVDGRKWGVAVHNSHFGLITNNIVYDVTGASFITEEGNERENVFDRNFAVKVGNIRTHIYEPIYGGVAGSNRPLGFGDFGWEGSAFWFTGNEQYVRGNVAANAAYAGVMYNARPRGFAPNTPLVPKIRGAEIGVSSEWQRFSIAPEILESNNNEIYASGVGTWVSFANHVGTLKNFLHWNIKQQGVYVARNHSVILDGFTVMSDPRVTSLNSTRVAPSMGLKFNVKVYKSGKITVRNAKVEGFGVGIGLPGNVNDNSTTGDQRITVVDNAYLRNIINVVDLSPRFPKYTLFRNVTMVQNPGPLNSASIVSSLESDMRDARITHLSRLVIFNHNRIPGNNFEYFFPEQAPDYVMQLRNAPKGTLSPQANCPTFGLTNFECWNTHRVATLGQVATCSDTSTRPEIIGITCPLASGTTFEGLLASNPRTETAINLPTYQPGPPTVTFLATPTTITKGGDAMLSWSAQNATECISSGGWSGARAILGTHKVKPSVSTVYTITCNGAQGTITQSVNVMVGGTPAPSPVPSTPTDTQAPSVPTNLSASDITTTSLTLRWSASTDNIAVTGYRVFRNGSQIGTSKTNSFNVTGLIASTTYSFAVSAYDAAGNQSGLSNTRVVTTSGGTPTQGGNQAAPIPTPPLTQSVDKTAPTISNIIVTGIEQSEVSIRWNTDEDATHAVDYGLTTTYGLDRSVNQLSRSPAIKLTNLLPNTTYQFRVRSKDVAGNESISFNQTFKTAAPPMVETNPPVAITDLRVLRTDTNSIDLVWPTVGVSGLASSIERYDLRYSTTPITETNWDSATPGSGTPTPSVTPTTETYTIVGLTPGTRYYVALKVVGINNKTSALSNVVEGMTPNVNNRSTSGSGTSRTDLGQTQIRNDLIPTVQNLIIQSDQTHVTLMWDNPTVPEYVRTIVVRKSGRRASVSPNDGTVIYEGLNSFVTDKSLMPRGEYTYSVFVIDRQGNHSRAASVVAELTTQPPYESRINRDNTVSSGGSNAPVGSGSAVSSVQSGTQAGRSFTKVLFLGLRDNDVAQLQEILINQGYLARDNVTGYFGPLTQAALRRFQCDKGIVCGGNEATTGYGVVGPRTREVLNTSVSVGSISNQVDTTTAVPPVIITPGSVTSYVFNSPLYPGLSNNEVRILQELLIRQQYLVTGSNTGYYGPLTMAAVQRYQCAKNIVCSGTPATTGWGLVGAKTRAILNTE